MANARPFSISRFKTFPMTPKTPQCEVFWALLSSSEHSGVPADSKPPTFPSVGLHPHTWPKWGCDNCLAMPIHPFTSATCVFNEGGMNLVNNTKILLASHPPQIVTIIPFKGRRDHIMCGIRLILSMFAAKVAPSPYF
jgi:hypothetical protein